VPPRRKKSPRARPAPAETGADERPGGRGVWSGTLSFGLVSIPVELYSAARADAAPLRMLGPDGTPLARRYVAESGRALEAADVERGYEVADGRFVVVTDEELERLAPRRSRDIELLRFVDRAELDPVWFERPYFLVPGAGQTKAYRLLAETMEDTGRAAIASFVMRGKSHAAAIFAERGVLRAETLRAADELRTPEEIGLPAPKKPDAARVARMKRAIDALAESKLDPKELRDDHAEKLLALARAKRRKGEDVFEAPEAAAAETEEGDGADIVDLVGLIRERLRRPGAKLA
jgi:DNA end-binding protein Ku